VESAKSVVEKKRRKKLCSIARLANGLKVSEIGYGMWGLDGWTGSDVQESMHRSMWRRVGLQFF
jgi:aryl-alcohol dehydrogenase-like predicted oxidoreductase